VSISSEIQKLSPSDVVSMFVLDATGIGGDIMRFHAGYGQTMEPLVWQGQRYDPLPIKIEDVARSGSGVEPRPVLTVGNVGRVMTTALKQHNDFLSATVIRKQTFVRFLDAENFSDGNPDADPTIELPDQRYKVERKVAETREVVQFELASELDLENRSLPSRQIIKNICPWRYRSAECGYTGGAVAKSDDTATSLSTEDDCGKRLASCKLRFGEFSELPTGAFPASNLIAKVSA